MKENELRIFVLIDAYLFSFEKMRICLKLSVTSVIFDQNRIKFESLL